MSVFDFSSDPDLGHVESVAQQLAEVHADYERQTPRSQRLITQITVWLAKPFVIVTLVGLAVVWIAYNGLPPHFGTKPWDPSPFGLLSLTASLLALFMTVLILAAQRREDELSRRRSQLTLQLATQTEQMISKVIHLLEEQRFENPLLSNRRDEEAEKMAKPSDPKVVLGHVIDSHREVEARG